MKQIKTFTKSSEMEECSDTNDICTVVSFYLRPPQSTVSTEHPPRLLQNPKMSAILTAVIEVYCYAGSIVIVIATAACDPREND